jgi:class 3 adenylate cyclase
MTRLTEVFNDSGSKVRRTLLVVDVNDATAMKEKEPEASWLATLGWFFDHVRDELDKENGSIVKLVGAGALAVFDEDDATRALNAAILIQEGIKAHNADQADRLTASIGVATGALRSFTVATQAGEVEDFLGLTVDRACSLSSAANGNAVFADGETIAAASMNRITSRAGDQLDRGLSDYQGQEQLITLKGFHAPVKYYEIWWDRDRYGVSPQFLTDGLQEPVAAAAPPAAPAAGWAPPPRQAPAPAWKRDAPAPAWKRDAPAQSWNRDAPGQGWNRDAPGQGWDRDRDRDRDSLEEDWLRGTVKRFGPDYGFLTTGNEDFFFNKEHLFDGDFEVRAGAEAVFQPMEPVAPGKSRRADYVFVLGQTVSGVVTKVSPKGFGFGVVKGQWGKTHDMFLLVNDVPDLTAGDRFECTIDRNEKGPIGREVEILT